MDLTNVLRQALQKQYQDVVNVMHFVLSIKAIIKGLKENNWDKLFTIVTSFCEKCVIEIPNLNDSHSATRLRHCHLERAKS